MAIGKAAGCLILAGAAWVSAAGGALGAQFTVRHEHQWGRRFRLPTPGNGCDGAMTVNEDGVSFAGPKGHAWTWKFQDIQELQLSPRSIHILTYRDSKLRMGADEGYEFTGKIPAGELYAILRDRMDQRLVAEIGQAGDLSHVAFSLPVKHLGRVIGSEGSLAFEAESVVYSTPKKDESRTWRYSDIDSISSSDRFQLTITTLEKSFNFQLKQPITEARYNELWLQIEKKNGRIQ
jgi:hypothetical protein